MLRGRKDHSVDPKGRIALPAKFREEILKRYGADALIVTRHLWEPCLEVWPKAEWEAFEEKVAKLPNFDRNVQTLRRIYIGSAADAELDGQGRVLIPPELRAIAKIDRDAVWIGQTRHAELWAKDLYDAQVATFQEKLAEGQLTGLTEELAKLGL